MKTIVGIGIALFMLIGYSLEALALSNEERVKMLDDKFIKGELSEETYKRLLQKYGGAAASSQPEAEAKLVKEVTGNLVKNFSFEKLASDGSAERWTIDHKHSNVVDIRVSTSVAHSGSNSMRFSSQKNYHSSEIAFQELPLQPGKKYKVVFRARGENLQSAPKADGMPCVVTVHHKTPDGKEKNIYIEPKIGNEWKQVAKIVNIPGNALPGGRISLRLYNASGTLWIDDVVVEQLP